MGKFVCVCVWERERGRERERERASQNLFNPEIFLSQQGSIIRSWWSRGGTSQLTLQSSQLFLQMLNQGLIRHDNIDLCFRCHFFCTTSKQKSVSCLLNMASCRTQSANDGSSSIATQARLQYACQLRISVIDVSLSSLTASNHHFDSVKR
jgi:hypothetical protein